MSFTTPTMGTTTYSPFYESTIGITSAGNESGYNNLPRYARSSTEMQLARLLAAPGFRTIRRVMKVLNGASAGSTATETYARVQALAPFSGAYGGARTVETVTLINAATTTAQRDYITNKILDARYNQNPSSYPVDASGNGGGGKAGR